MTSGRPFSLQVVIEHGPRVGTFRAVDSVRTAAECLISGWPEKDRGRHYKAAVQACHAALAGTLEADTARKAFNAAAKEVDIFGREGR